MFKKLKGERGSTIILTLIVVVVLSLLGTALWQYGMSSTLLVNKEVKRKEAYYIAKSGADAMVAHILNATDTAQMKSYIDKVNGKTSKPVSLGTETFQIEIKRDGGNILIKSTSVVGGETASVTAVVKEKISAGFPFPIFPNALFSDAHITLNGNVEVIGGIECTGTVTVNGNKNPSYIEYSTKKYPEIVFPNNPSSENLDIKKNVYVNDTYTISTDSSFNSISVRNDCILHFDLTAGDLEVVVNSLDVDGELTVTGPSNHRLYLYVQDFIGVGEVNANNTLPLSSFIVLMPPSGQYDVSRFKGLLYGPGASVKLNGGPTFTGAMVAGEIRNNGNPTVTYSADAQTVDASVFDSVEVTATSSIAYEMDKWR